MSVVNFLASNSGDVLYLATKLANETLGATLPAVRFSKQEMDYLTQGVIPYLKVAGALGVDRIRQTIEGFKKRANYSSQGGISNLSSPINTTRPVSNNQQERERNWANDLRRERSLDAQNLIQGGVDEESLEEQTQEDDQMLGNEMQQKNYLNRVRQIAKQKLKAKVKQKAEKKAEEKIKKAFWKRILFNPAVLTILFNVGLFMLGVVALIIVVVVLDKYLNVFDILGGLLEKIT